MQDKRVLVTGGAGFLGAAVVRELAEAGVTALRVLARPGEALDNLEGLDVEVVRGDVLSVEDCKRAAAERDVVFHLAAIYRDYMPDPSPMYAVNMRGTYNMLEAARRAGVQTVVYTASIVALGRPAPGALGDEQTPYNAWDVDFPYSRSKHLSMWLAEDFAAWGLDVRVICPGMVFGPGDIGPTPSGQLVINVAKGETPAYTDGGCSYVDVRDVARVHRLVVERGAPGERYLATAHNLSNKQFFQTIARLAGTKQRFPWIPVRVARAYIKLLAKIAIRRGEEPLLTPAMFDYSCRPPYFDNRKSIDELGASYRPIEETIADALAYFRARGVLE